MHKAPHAPRQYFDEISGGRRALFPLVVLVGLNALEPTRPRPRSASSPPTSATRSACRTNSSSSSSRSRRSAALLLDSPARVLLRPASTYAHRGTGRGGLGASSGCSPGSPSPSRMLMLARSGSGIGRAVVTPDAQLADSPTIYPPEVRADVFGFHRDRASRSVRSSARCSADCSARSAAARVPFFVFVPSRRWCSCTSASV